MIDCKESTVEVAEGRTGNHELADQVKQGVPVPFTGGPEMEGE